MSRAICSKGIILAGGSGSRMGPITAATNKQLLPVYDKPLVYYPLATLMLAGIREILLISSGEDIGRFQRLLGDGRKLGISIDYAVQPRPEGLAQAFIIGRSFIGDDSVALILGDNIFFGRGFRELLARAAACSKGATIFAYQVKDPRRYGVIEMDEGGRPIALTEKPANPKSNLAVPGIYFYDNQVIDIAARLMPSDRGELEITDVNRAYLRLGQLRVEQLGRGFAWLDSGTPNDLLQAANFIAAIEQRQGLRISCPEETAARMRFITPSQLQSLADEMKNDYGDYLREVARQLQCDGEVAYVP